MLSLYVRNVKTVKGIADYEYVVMVNAETIAEGKVTGHRRRDGWGKLVKRIGEQGEKSND
jgi:hypothetical protein